MAVDRGGEPWTTSAGRRSGVGLPVSHVRAMRTAPPASRLWRSWDRLPSTAVGWDRTVPDGVGPTAEAEQRGALLERVQYTVTAKSAAMGARSARATTCRCTGPASRMTPWGSAPLGGRADLADIVNCLLLRSKSTASILVGRRSEGEELTALVAAVDAGRRRVRRGDLAENTVQGSHSTVAHGRRSEMRCMRRAATQPGVALPPIRPALAAGNVSDDGRQT